MTARVGKGSSHLNRHRAYIGLIRDFRVKIGQISVLQTLARSLLKGLVRFLLLDWLVFCLVAQELIWLWIQGQSVFL